MAGHIPSDPREAPAAFDRTGRASRAGSVVWVLLLAAILVAVWVFAVNRFLRAGVWD